jgi:hypothetical protein
MVGVVALLELYATLAAGLFSGASIYINLVEHPVRMQCGTALAQFAPSYKRTTLMQASLAATGFLAALGAYVLGAGTRWLNGRHTAGTDSIYIDCDFANQSPPAKPGSRQRFSQSSAITRSLGKSCTQFAAS